MEAGIARGEPDDHQVAANELAWGTAHAEAAKATAAWAQATDDPLSHDIALASVAEAMSSICGAPSALVIETAPLLQSIAERYQPRPEVKSESSEHQLLRRTFREFAQAEVAPHAERIHRENLDIPEEIIEGLAGLGVFGISVPETYGGSRPEDDDLTSMLIVTEELSRASLAAGGSLVTRPEILVRAILRAGTDDQKQQWLPAIAGGEKLVAVATTEPDSGSDVAKLRCRAEPVSGGWQVSGSKLWCTFAGRAELLMLLLRTADTGHRGLSVFVAEKPAFTGHEFTHEQSGGGTLTGRAIPTIGYRGMHTFELAFDRFFLPDDALVGGNDWLNRGFYLQMESFAIGRLQTAGRAIGVMEAALDSAIAYARDRSTFGKPIAAHGLPGATLGRMVVRVAAARQLSHRAARLLGSGDAQMQASLAKLYASRMAEYVTRDAMQLHGGMGYAEETDVSRYFVNARVLPIFEGAEEVLALRVVARSLLAS